VTVNKSTGPMKFYIVDFSYTVHNTARGTVAALDEDDARFKILEQIGKQVDDIIVTDVMEVENPNEGPVDHDDLPEGVTSLSKHRTN